MKVIKSKIIHFPVIQRLQRAGNNNYTKNNYRQTINCHLRLSDIIFLYTICQPLMMLIMTPTTRRLQHSNGQCKSINHEWRKSTTDNLWQQPQKQKHKQQQTANISANDATTAMRLHKTRKHRYYDEIDKNQRQCWQHKKATKMCCRLVRRLQPSHPYL